MRFSPKGILLLFLVFTTSAFSQYREINLLFKTINNTKSDLTKSKSYYELSEIYGDLDLDSVLLYCNKSIELADKNLENLKDENEINNFLKVKAAAINNIGFYFRQKGAISLALDNFNSSLDIRQQINDEKGIAECNSNLGYIYNNSGEISKALICHNKSLRIRESINDLKGQAISLNRIASIYMKQAEKLSLYYTNLKIIDYKISQAFFCYNKSLEIAKKLDNKEQLALSLNSMGLIHFSILKGIYSIAQFNDSAKTLMTKCNDYFNQSLTLRKSINDKQGIADCLNNIARLYLLQNDIDNANKSASISLEIANKIGFPELIKNAAFTLNIIHEKLGNTKEAYKMYKLYVIMNDSIEGSSTIQKQFEFEFQRKLEADSLKKIRVEQNIAEAQLEKEKTYRVFLLLGVLIIAIFGGISYNRYHLSLRQNIVITKQREAAEIQSNQIVTKSNEILASINYAKRIQTTILPSQFKIDKLLPESFVVFLPKDIVSGDFYFIESNKLNPELVFVAACDCTGHGVPGAMVSVVCHTELSRAIKEEKLSNAAQILDHTDEGVVYRFSKNNVGDDLIRDGMDASLLVFNTTTNEISWAGANNPIWIIKNNGAFLEIKGDKQPIGRIENKKPFTEHKIQLEKSDTVYLFSDGYADQFGGEFGKKLSRRRLKELLLEIYNLPLATQKTEIEKYFTHYKGNEQQVDDVCIIGFKV
jgi:serine phosphatase RsbU (regulator of sigma subunit)